MLKERRSAKRLDILDSKPAQWHAFTHPQERTTMIQNGGIASKGNCSATLKIDSKIETSWLKSPPPPLEVARFGTRLLHHISLGI